MVRVQRRLLEKKEKRWVTNGDIKLFRKVSKVGGETRGIDETPLLWRFIKMDSGEGRDGGLCV